MIPTDRVSKKLSGLDGRDKEAEVGDTNPKVAKWHPQLSPSLIGEEGGAGQDSSR